ncbi:MAG: DUF4123 domain-containing protein [Desulfamplus sp.]|nr:DUF4123 domain-containing protein [Desulfamplus sp.]
MEAAENNKIITDKKAVLHWFQNLKEPLFAILDAARDEEILGHVYNGTERFSILFEGDEAVELIGVGPYLVEFSKPSNMLETLIEKGWGKSWGIFITADADFQATASHFRQLLIVELEDGEEVYFRFYDPRVLRIYLPTCNQDELRQIFGPVKALLMEDDKLGILNFTYNENGLCKSDILAINNTLSTKEISN